MCHCNVVRDGEISELIAGGAASVEELTAHCGAGGRCGSCTDVLARMLDAVQAGDLAA
ncbi:MAG: (2Fe-2S)-binding protein [Actinomycetota bacterium]